MMFYVDVYCSQEHIKWEWLAIREIHPRNTSLHLARKCFNMDTNEWDWSGIIQQIGLVHELSWFTYIYIHITNNNESSNPNFFGSIMPSVYQCTYLVGAALAMRVEPWRHWPRPCRQKKAINIWAKQKDFSAIQSHCLWWYSTKDVGGPLSSLHH